MNVTPQGINITEQSNQYLSIFYRGPYAFAASDYTGFSCGYKGCPRGDDPLTPGINEIQQLQFNAEEGWFTLEFRGNVTNRIFCNETLSKLEYYLEELYTYVFIVVFYRVFISIFSSL